MILRTRDGCRDGFGGIGSMDGGNVNDVRHGEFVGEGWDVE
jgi:hypothetical protein